MTLASQLAKVAQTNPNFAKKLHNELLKTAMGDEGWKDTVGAAQRKWTTQVTRLAFINLGKVLDLQPGRVIVKSGFQWVAHTGSFKNNPWFASVVLKFAFQKWDLTSLIVLENREAGFRETLSGHFNIGNYQPSAIAKAIAAEAGSSPGFKAYQEAR